MKGNILVVSPYSGPQLNTTIANVARELSGRFRQVDIMTPEGDYSVHSTSGIPKTPRAPSAENPAAKPEGRIRNAVMRRIRPRLFERRDYAAIIGVDPRGLEMANKLNARARLPLIYLSFEILFEDELTDAERPLKTAERAACRNVVLTLVQDHERGEHLARETGLSRSQMVFVPNAPLPVDVPDSRWLRDRLAIEDDTRIVLYAGTPAGWAGLHLWEEMVATWPEDFLLVVHCRSDLGPRMNAYLQRLAATGRIRLSHGPIPEDSLPWLYASADYGLAPYMPVPDNWTSGKNVHHLGFSSGKVGWYAMCGLPILASSLPVFEREFERYGCGAVYARVAETGSILSRMEREYSFHAQESERFYAQRLDPTDGLHNFCGRLEELCTTEGIE